MLHVERLYNGALLCKRCSLLNTLANLRIRYKIENRDEIENKEASSKYSGQTSRDF